jgi:flavin reductase (DIM6/NTAB) family NADH-FMN oxidoreductase RutF
VTRIEVDVLALPPGGPYRLVNACVIPRPIAWVATISAAGVHNVAPHSFFTVASNDPATVMFSSVGVKDTLRNVVEVPECVINVSTYPLREVINQTSTDFPPDVDELQVCGLTALASHSVRPVRVAESPIALECRVTQTVPVGASTVIFCEVLHVSMEQAVLAADGLPDAGLVQPVTRLGRNDWGTLGGVFSLAREPYSDWLQRQP